MVDFGAKDFKAVAEIEALRKENQEYSGLAAYLQQQVDLAHKTNTVRGKAKSAIFRTDHFWIGL